MFYNNFDFLYKLVLFKAISLVRKNMFESKMLVCGQQEVKCREGNKYPGVRSGNTASLLLISYHPSHTPSPSPPPTPSFNTHLHQCRSTCPIFHTARECRFLLCMLQLYATSLLVPFYIYYLKQISTKIGAIKSRAIQQQALKKMRLNFFSERTVYVVIN